LTSFFFLLQEQRGVLNSYMYQDRDSF